MKNICITIFSLLLLMSLTSCNDWLDINEDPNNPSSVPAELVLPAAQMDIAVSLNAEYAVVGGLWSQHWTQSHVASQYRDEDRYALTLLDYQIPWREMYAGALVDLAYVESEAVIAQNWNLNLMAVCLQAYAYQIMADWYDQIPYTQAGQGSDGITSPVFDQGQVVYNDLLSRLDAALAQDFSGDGVAQVSSDFLFGHLSRDEQVNAWTQFANTLKLKLWLRQTKVNDAGAGTAIAALLADGNFLTQDAKVDVFSDLPDKSNPLYESNVRQLNVATNLRGSRTLISWLEENGDPRLDAYFTPGDQGHFGLWQGWFEATNTEVTPDQVDIAKLSATQPVYYFSRDEVMFMLAEANLRYGNAAEAPGLYTAAVEAACTRAGTNCAALVGAGGVYEYPGGSMEENLEAIIMQKWASMVYRGYESFWDQNRTGIPALSEFDAFDTNVIPGTFTYSVAGMTDNNLFPKRLIFPQSERNSNTNIPAEVAITVPVWWAQ